MLPFMFLGFWTAEQIAVYLGLTQSNNMNLVNKIDSTILDKVVNFLYSYEGYASKAYNLGDGKITIGYGTTQWLSPTGTVLRAVKMGDTIDQITARQQVYNYFVPAIPIFNMILAKNNYRVHPALLVALLQTLYMTGQYSYNYSCFRDSLTRANGVTDTKKIASIYITETIETLKTLKGGIAYYNKYALGWSRRVKAASDFIDGVIKPKIWYDKNFFTPY